MKKSLFLLPLLAGLALCGCGDDKGGGTGGGGSGGGGGGGGGEEEYKRQEHESVDVDEFEIDFTTEYSDYKGNFPYVGPDTGRYEVELGDLTFEGLGCYVSSYSGSGFLQMKNKEMSGDPAYITLLSPFEKAITSVEIVTSASVSTKTKHYVCIGDQVLDSATDGGVKVNGAGASKTITATASASKDYHYFGIFTSDIKTNGQIASIKVTLE